MSDLYVSIECWVSRTNVHVRIITITWKGMEHGIYIYVIYGSNFLRFSFHWFVRIVNAYLIGHDKIEIEIHRSEHTHNALMGTDNGECGGVGQMYLIERHFPKILLDFPINLKMRENKKASNTHGRTRRKWQSIKSICSNINQTNTHSTQTIAWLVGCLSCS